MDTIFTLKDNDNSEKINLDDLYEKKKQHDLNTLNIYNKILGRIHCSMSELVLAIEDVEAQKEWVMRTIDARIIEKINVL